MSILHPCALYALHNIVYIIYIDIYLHIYNYSITIISFFPYFPEHSGMMFLHILSTLLCMAVLATVTGELCGMISIKHDAKSQQAGTNVGLMLDQHRRR